MRGVHSEREAGRFSWVSRLQGLGVACVSAALLLSSCGDDVASSEAAPVAEFAEAVEAKPAPSAMQMTRRDEPKPAVAEPVLLDDQPATPVEVDAPLAPTPEVTEPAPIPAEREPVEVRTARQRLIVRIAPHNGAPLRARIPMGESFEVFELVDGRDCGGKGWADVGNGGFVCLEKSRKATEEPQTLPRVKGEGVLPYYFAKIPDGKSARRWKSLKSYHAGDEPQVITAPGRDFAFRSRLRAKGQIVLVDKRGRVMAERDLQRFRPSSFSGHDLVAQPVPEGTRLAWAVQWPETTVYTEASTDSPLAPSLDYHTEIYVDPTPIEHPTGTFYALADGQGFLSSRNIRRYEAVPSLGDEAVAEDEIWIDVELGQQVLTVMQGSQPIYVTLISSGKKGPTPRGLFRINKKQAVGSMSSAPGAADPYAVEAVPYVQYFHGGIALHSAYWHNLFGFRVSHGCVNLSPRDAAHVYSLTGPHARDGWMDVYEDEGDLGTRVRVREGDTPVSDRRGPVEHVRG